MGCVIEGFIRVNGEMLFELRALDHKGQPGRSKLPGCSVTLVTAEYGRVFSTKVTGDYPPAGFDDGYVPPTNDGQEQRNDQESFFA
jgi:hypothetical protein